MSEIARDFEGYKDSTWMGHRALSSPCYKQERTTDCRINEYNAAHGI